MADPLGVHAWMTGSRIASHGLREVREAALASGVRQAHLARAAERLNSLSIPRSGAIRAIRSESAIERRMWDFYRFLLFDFTRQRGPFICIPSDPPPSESLAYRFFRDPVPHAKRNMTYNLRGRHLEDVIRRFDLYQMHVPEHMHAAHGLGELGLFSLSRNFGGHCVIGLFMSDDCGRIPNSFARLVADMYLTQIFLALRCYQLENGRLPAALNELVPKYLDELPVDPFTEDAFLYEPNADPPRVRSVGTDQEPDDPTEEYGDDTILELNFAAPSARDDEQG
jgi:hypothetical protein